MRDKQKNNENNTKNYLFVHLKFVKKNDNNRDRNWSSIFDLFWHPFSTILGASGDPFGRLGRPFGRPWAVSGVSCTLSGRIFGPSWSLLGPSWLHFGQFWSLQGHFGPPPSLILEPLGTNFGPQWADNSSSSRDQKVSSDQRESFV